MITPCIECKKKHARCGFERPCTRCESMGLECKDVPKTKRKRRGKKKDTELSFKNTITHKKRKICSAKTGQIKVEFTEVEHCPIEQQISVPAYLDEPTIKQWNRVFNTEPVYTGARPLDKAPLDACLDPSLHSYVNEDFLNGFQEQPQQATFDESLLYFDGEIGGEHLKAGSLNEWHNPALPQREEYNKDLSADQKVEETLNELRNERQVGDYVNEPKAESVLYF